MQIPRLICVYVGEHLRTFFIYVSKRKRQGRTYREIHKAVTDPDLAEDDELGRYTNGCASLFYGFVFMMVLFGILVKCVH